MLQQTRVETVLPYFERFMRRFPSVEELAAAEVNEVLALWSGLGYYRRGRQLHAAARQVVAMGEMPRTVEALLRLPGIGEYTAAAVASMAYGVAVPVLDGNVERLLCRLLALAEDPRRRAVRRRLLTAAADLVDEERPGDSNQALMELGATVCTPRRPSCERCPLRPRCRALGQGEPERFPPPRKRRASRRERRLVAVVEDGGRLLLFRRPDDSALLAGTWELPWVALAGATDPAGVARREVEGELARRYGGRWRVGHRLAAVRHGITHRAIEAEVHRCAVAAGDEVAEGMEAGWFGAGERRGLASSSLVGKVVAAVAAAEGEPSPSGGPPAPGDEEP